MCGTMEGLGLTRVVDVDNIQMLHLPTFPRELGNDEPVPLKWTSFPTTNPAPGHDEIPSETTGTVLFFQMRTRHTALKC